MRKSIFFVVLALFVVVSIIGCGPVPVEQFVNIAANETAFLVPLEGQTNSGQKKFFSEEYLNENKIAAKRISLPLRKWKTGRAWWSYKYIATMAVIKVDRSPVTREWTGDSKKGTSSKDEALWVESRDSIGFGVGANVTAMVTEEDAAKFLYNFAGKPLASVVDENVRGKINSVLSLEFAKHNLESGRTMKNEIFKTAADETISFFASMGVTITNLGLAEGMVYQDKEIQDAINKAFTAEMQIQVEEQQNLAQAKINERNIDIAIAEKKAAEEFAKAADARKKQVEVEIALMLAQAKIGWVDKWNGELPAKMLPDNSSLMFNFSEGPQQ